MAKNKDQKGSFSIHLTLSKNFFPKEKSWSFLLIKSKVKASHKEIRMDLIVFEKVREHPKRKESYEYEDHEKEQQTTDIGNDVSGGSSASDSANNLNNQRLNVMKEK